MKPILVDALHINTGGALMILNHFVDRLVARNVPFVLLKDVRCPQLRSEAQVGAMEVLPCRESIRRRYYNTHTNEFSRVLCLGNVPPPVRPAVRTYTYIHNVSLLQIPKDYSCRWKTAAFLKKIYIRHLSRNTDYWVVQTSYTASLVRKNLPCKGKEILCYPFYFMPRNVEQTPTARREDYIFVGEHTNAKGHQYLVDAWVKLSDLGVHKTLHMTVHSPYFRGYIEQAQAKGASIVNHGRIDFAEVVRLYNQSKATVYPSLNESLGLGIIEALEAGCDVIGSDLPYLHSVCEPSEVFLPADPDAIVDAVLRYEQGISTKSRLRIHDMADEFIEKLL